MNDDEIQALNELEKEEWQFTQKDLQIDWKKIMEHFKIPAWPQVWELLSLALNRVLADIKERNTEKEILTLKESIEIQLSLAKLALESAEKSLNSLFNLFNEDNC